MKNLIIGLLISAASFSAAAQKKVELQARKSVGKVLIKGRKTYTYNALSEKSKAEYVVVGPGVLYVNTRVRLPENQFSSESFKVKCIKSGEHVSLFRVPELLASNLKFSNSSLAGTPSRHFQHKVIVPPGKHTYRFYKYGTEQKASIRVFYEAHPKPKWSEATPLASLDNVELKYTKSGKTRNYKKLGKNDSYLFSISDTTRLRIQVRPEFTYRMLDETILKVKLLNTNTLEETVYKLKARKSKTLEYAAIDNKIPGTFNTIYLDIPAPLVESIYELSLVGGTKALAVRITKDLNLNKQLP